MSNFNEAQFEDLLSRYLDAQLDPGEEERLRQYLTNEGYSRRFLELTKLNAEIAGLSAAPVPDAVMVELVMRELRDDSKPALPFPVPPMAVEDYSTPEVVGKPPHPRAASYRGPLLAMAACLCLLGVAAAFFSGVFQAAPISQITGLRGEVTFSGKSGQISLTDNGTVRGNGTLQTVGAESRAILGLADGTQITVDGDSTVAVDVTPGHRRVTVTAGGFHARVAKQGNAQDLVFATPNAEALVQGTEFTLLWENPNSRVIVTEGAVEVRRTRDGFAVLVKAGRYVHVEMNGEFRSWPISYLPKDLQEKARPPK